jgi:CRISPR-associated endonuclease Cas3-HD
MSSDPQVDSSKYNARWSEDHRAAQPLHAHLARVSSRCRRCADVLRPTDLPFQNSAALAGILHDLGKYRTQFQSYLNAGDRGKRSIETAHSVYGAAAAEAE